LAFITREKHEELTHKEEIPFNSSVILPHSSCSSIVVLVRHGFTE
jgi:hypothetical protein